MPDHCAMARFMDDRQEAKGAKSCKEPSERLDDVARRVIGAAIEVHRHLGPGFSEGVYEEALAIEFELRGVPFVRQPTVEVVYKGHSVGHGRPDFIVGGHLVVEIKAIPALGPAHQAQVISYLRALRSELGLLLNFKEPTTPRPAPKPIVDRFPRPKMYIQISPRNSCASNPDNSVDEITVPCVRLRTATLGKTLVKHGPLLVCERMARHSHLRSERYTQCKPLALLASWRSSKTDDAP